MDRWPYLGWCHHLLHSHHCPGIQVFDSWTLDFWNPWSQKAQVPSHHLPYSGKSSSRSSEPRRNGPLLGGSGGLGLGLGLDSGLGLCLAGALEKVWWGAARGSHPSGPCLIEDRPSCLLEEAGEPDHPVRPPQNHPSKQQNWSQPDTETVQPQATDIHAPRDSLTLEKPCFPTHPTKSKKYMPSGEGDSRTRVTPLSLKFQSTDQSTGCRILVLPPAAP